MVQIIAENKKETALEKRTANFNNSKEPVFKIISQTNLVKIYQTPTNVCMYVCYINFTD